MTIESASADSLPGVRRFTHFLTIMASGALVGFVGLMALSSLFFARTPVEQEQSAPEPPAPAPESSSEPEAPGPEASADSPPPVIHRRSRLRWAAHIGGQVLNVVLAVALVCALFVGYGLINNRWYHLVVVEGSSMYPTIVSGDLIVITRPPGQIEPGMILTMEVDNKIVTHRVVQVNPDGSFITKGDANEARDDFSSNRVRVIGQYQFRIPAVGALLPMDGSSGAWFASRLGLSGSGTAGAWDDPPAPPTNAEDPTAPPAPADPTVAPPASQVANTEPSSADIATPEPSEAAVPTPDPGSADASSQPATPDTPTP